ncbi:MAG TPA: hypothetical protein PLW92_02770 [Chitinophagales bacterium]|nr:hypothetical protein [Chitinophagales bacterium]
MMEISKLIRNTPIKQKHKTELARKMSDYFKSIHPHHNCGRYYNVMILNLDDDDE